MVSAISQQKTTIPTKLVSSPSASLTEYLFFTNERLTLCIMEKF
jgi:hypothetical protein